MTRRTNNSLPGTRQAQSADLARGVGSVKELAGKRVGQLRESIAQLKAAQRRLTKAGAGPEDRLSYKDHFQFAPDGYLVTDMHGKIQEANLAATHGAPGQGTRVRLNVPLGGKTRDQSANEKASGQ